MAPEPRSDNGLCGHATCARKRGGVTCILLCCSLASLCDERENYRRLPLWRRSLWRSGGIPLGRPLLFFAVQAPFGHRGLALGAREAKGLLPEVRGAASALIPSRRWLCQSVLFNVRLEPVRRNVAGRTRGVYPARNG